MRSTMVITISSLALLFGTADAQAQISADSLKSLEKGCNSIKKIQRTFSTDGAIRADYITFCAAKSGENVIWFEAAAMKQEDFRGSSSAPWMAVELLDSSGNSLHKRADAWLVEIAQCGGYEFHLHRVPNNLSGEVYDVRVSMGGTSGTSCNRRDPWRDVVATVARVIRASKDCDTPELDMNEREICKFAKANGIFD